MIQLLTISEVCHEHEHEALLLQDPPSPTSTAAHQAILFKKIHRRLRIEKGLVGAAYLAVFALAFWASLQANQVQEEAMAIWWTVGSLHLLLWFLVFFLWRLEGFIVRIPPPQTVPGQQEGNVGWYSLARWRPAPWAASCSTS